MGLKADLQTSLHAAALKAANEAKPEPSKTLPKPEEFEGIAAGIAAGMSNVLKQLEDLRLAVETMQSALPAAFTACGVGPAAAGPAASAAYTAATTTVTSKLPLIKTEIIKLDS